MSPARLRAIASGLGVGFAPVAPGTAGTLAAVPLALALGFLPAWVRVCLLVASLPLAAAVCSKAAAEAGEEDPGWIVLDEIVGYCIAVAWAPRVIQAHVAGFLLFRLFDIVKPPPAGWIDRRLGGGWGILLDDVCAGLYTALAIAALAWAGAF